MEEKYQSEWSRELPMKEQLTIVQRLFRFAKPFRRMFYTAILFAFGLSIINILLPRVIQVFMDNYLTPKTATMQVILTFLCYLFFWCHCQKYCLVFPMVFVFDGFFKNVSIYTSEII